MGAQQHLRHLLLITLLLTLASAEDAMFWDEERQEPWFMLLWEEWTRQSEDGEFPVARSPSCISLSLSPHASVSQPRPDRKPLQTGAWSYSALCFPRKRNYSLTTA